MGAFSRFWTFMVIELPKDLGPYSQMSSLSMLMHRAFPMPETNEVRFEYEFTHLLCLAIVVSTMVMAWPMSNTEVEEKDMKALLARSVAGAEGAGGGGGFWKKQKV